MELTRANTAVMLCGPLLQVLFDDQDSFKVSKLNTCLIDKMCIHHKVDWKLSTCISRFHHRAFTLAHGLVPRAVGKGSLFRPRRSNPTARPISNF